MQRGDRVLIMQGPFAGKQGKVYRCTEGGGFDDIKPYAHVRLYEVVERGSYRKCTLTQEYEWVLIDWLAEA